MTRSNSKIAVQILSGLVLLSSCLPQRKSAPATENITPSLELTGLLANPGGAVLAGVDVYIENENQPISKSGSDGSFKIKIEEDKLKTISNSISKKQTWNLYFKQPGTIELGGMSTPIAFSQRGLTNLGVVQLKPTSEVRGFVLTYIGGSLTAATGSNITLGREKASAGNDGSFVIKSVPAGNIPFEVSYAKFEGISGNQEIPSGTAYFLKDPVVLFQGNQPAAALIMQPQPKDANGITNPTLRTFKVYANSTAKYIRYSHSIDEIKAISNNQNSNQNSNQNQTDSSANSNSSSQNQSFLSWKPITETITYTFLNEGPASLWYQVTGDSQDAKSDFAKISLNINSCEDFKGITLGDGSGTITQRKTRLHFNNLPSNATRVKLSEDLANIQNRPWLAIGPSLEYIFPINASNDGSSSSTGDQNAPVATRQLFAMIGTTSGDCPVYGTTANLNVFPSVPSPAVILNGGAQVSISRLVQVDIPNIPANAIEMRITDATATLTSGSGSGSNTSSNTSNSTPWLRVQTSTYFMFSSTGSRVLNLQFRDSDGITSSTYRATIDVIPYQQAGILLSFAQLNPLVPIIPPPPSRYLIMQLIPPPNAIAFRFMEHITDGGSSNLGGSSTAGNTSQNASTDPADIVTQPWLNLVPFMPLYARGPGLRTFIAQYLSVDGITSTVTQSITIAPVLLNTGEFLINGGSSLTLFPTVKLLILPPATSIAMSATNLSLQQTTANNSTIFSLGSFAGSSTSSSNDQWLSISPTLDFKLDSRGVQTIQMRFRDPNGNVESPAVAHSIFYDPFPPFPIGYKPLKINNDDPVATSSLVNISITAPESANSYRVSTDPSFTGVSEFQDIPGVEKTSLPGIEWKVFQFNTDFILTGTTGPRIIYVEFKNELGDRSASIYDTIMYQPTP